MMREPLFANAPLFDIEHIKKINSVINDNLVEAKDKPDQGAIKSSQVKFVHLIQVFECLYKSIYY